MKFLAKEDLPRLLVTVENKEVFEPEEGHCPVLQCYDALVPVMNESKGTLTSDFVIPDRFVALIIPSRTELYSKYQGTCVYPVAQLTIVTYHVSLGSSLGRNASPKD